MTKSFLNTGRSNSLFSQLSVLVQTFVDVFLRELRELLLEYESLPVNSQQWSVTSLK